MLLSQCPSLKEAVHVLVQVLGAGLMARRWAGCHSPLLQSAWGAYSCSKNSVRRLKGWSWGPASKKYHRNPRALRFWQRHLKEVRDPQNRIRNVAQMFSVDPLGDPPNILGLPLLGAPGSYPEYRSSSFCPRL